MFAIAIIPWWLWAIVMAFTFLVFLTIGAVVLIMGVLLIPVRIGLAVVSLGLQLVFLPFSLLTGRRWR